MSTLLTDWKIEIKTHKNAICANNLTLSRVLFLGGNGEGQPPKPESYRGIPFFSYFYALSEGEFYKLVKE